MNITIYELQNIKKSCNYLSELIKNIIKERYDPSTDKPFNSLSDYENSIKDKEIRPDLYFKLQVYNRMTYITYRKNTKNYHIVTKGFNSEYLKKFKRYSNSEDCFIIGPDLEKTKEVWYEVIQDCISTLKPVQEFTF